MSNRNPQRRCKWIMFGNVWVGMAIALAGTPLVGQTVAAHPSVDDTRAAKELLARPITVRLTRVSLAVALDSIARIAKTAVQYQEPIGKTYQEPVSIDARGMPLGIVFEHVLSGTNLRVIPTDDRDLVVVAAGLVGSDSVPTTGIVIGRVVDSASAQGLNGAVIKVAGTKLSVLTTDSGRFVLRGVPVGNRILSVKLFGYRPVEQHVTMTENGHATVRVAMARTANVLAGVVTTATGQQRRVEVGNDITVLNADSVMRVAPVQTVTDLLETRVPGLVVQRTSGIPGAPSRLRLRGASSVLASDDPIVIVDGVRVYADQSGTITGRTLGSIVTTTGGGSGIVSGSSGSDVIGVNNYYAGPSALDQIDPNSIETVEVLKGPSATAIYGSDAANGVIVIATKHGRAGPTYWSLTLNGDRTTLPGDWPANYYRFGHSEAASGIRGYRQSALCLPFEGFGGAFNPLSCVQDSVQAYQALNDPRLSPLGTGWDHDASLTVSGGSNKLTYSVTGSASDQNGYLHLPDVVAQLFDSMHGFAAPGWMKHPDVYTTYGGNGSVTAALGQTGASLALSTSLYQSDQQQGSLQQVLTGMAYDYYSSGTIAASQLLSNFSNMYERAQLHSFTTTNALALTNWTPWQWLPLHGTAGLSFRSTDNSIVLPHGYDIDRFAADSLGHYRLSRRTDVTKTLDAGTTLFGGHFLPTTVGLNVNMASQHELDVATAELPIGVTVPVSLPQSTSAWPMQNQSNTSTYGWYVVPQLRLNDRFFLSPGFRLDGGSASGSNAQTNIFPKMDVSWIALDRQESTPLFGVLTSLRPRIAFGIAGVQPGPTEQFRLLQPEVQYPTTANGPGAGVQTVSVIALGNTRVHPERSRELEGGAEMYLWGNRVQLTLTGYDKLRRDAIEPILVGQSVLPELSLQQFANVGDIRNRGVEATVHATVVDTRALQWSVDGNVAHNSNVMVRATRDVDFNTLADLTAMSSGYVTRFVPGYPIDGVWARPILGFADANGDGVIAPTEVRLGDSLAYIGSAQPNYELTLNNTLSFLNNRLTINTAVDFQQGLTQFLGAGNSLACGTQSCALQWLANPTLPAGEQAAIASLSQTAIGLAQKVSVLRWQSLSVSYIVPPSLSRRIRLPSLSLALQGSNLVLHTNYRGKDPNVNAQASGNLTQDTGQLPQPRLWRLSVRLGN